MLNWSVSRFIITAKVRVSYRRDFISRIHIFFNDKLYLLFVADFTNTSRRILKFHIYTATSFMVGDCQNPVQECSHSLLPYFYTGWWRFRGFSTRFPFITTILRITFLSIVHWPLYIIHRSFLDFNLPSGVSVNRIFSKRFSETFFTIRSNTR